MSLRPGATEAAFRTRRGRCVVDDDEIRLEESVGGHVRTAWAVYRERASAFTHVVAAFLLVTFVWAGVVVNRSGDGWAMFLNGVVALYAVLGVAAWAYLRFVREEGIERIPRESVREVRAVAGSGGRTSPPRVVVVHDAEVGVQRRLVLPTTPGGDDAEAFEAALSALREAGYDVAEE